MRRMKRFSGERTSMALIWHGFRSLIMPVLSGKSPPFGQGKVGTTFGELEKEVSRKVAEQRMQFAGMFLLSLTISGSNEAQNPAAYDGNLDPNYRLDQIELNSKNGFKNYDYVSLPQTTLDWLKENYPMPGDAKFMGLLVDKGTGNPSLDLDRVTKPSSDLDLNAKPKGTYSPNDTPGYIRQNESADLPAKNGYDIEMLDEVSGGNGYGIKESKNPDFLIEGKVYDSYTPKSETSQKNIIKELYGKTKDQAPNIILNLDDYAGDVDELIDLIKQKATPNGDLKRLEDLKIIKDGEIINIFND